MILSEGKSCNSVKNSFQKREPYKNFSKIISDEQMYAEKIYAQDINVS